MSDDKQMTWMSASQKPSGRKDDDWSEPVVVRYYTAGGAEDVTIGWYNSKDGRWYLYGVPDGITVMDWAYMEVCGR